MQCLIWSDVKNFFKFLVIKMKLIYPKHKVFFRELFNDFYPKII